MSPRQAIAVIALLLVPVSPAFADAIDGHWCDGTSRHLEINGPSVVTPSGANLRGDYNRHGFRYVEPADGKPIVMVLQSETMMHLKAGDGPEETWHRCAAPTS